MIVRRELRWGLGLTALLTTVALMWRPGPTAENGPPWPQNQTPSPWPESASPAAGQGRTAASSATLPSTLERMPYTAAERDLFAGPPKTIQGDTPKPPPAMAIQAPPSAAPPPAPPPMTASFFGRIHTPEGQTLTYLRDGDQTVLAKVGATLPSGYVVEALLPASPAAAAGTSPQREAEPASVRLIYPALGHHETLRLPADNEP